MLADLGEGGVGLGAGGFQALAQFALVLDLLFDAGQLAADAVDLGLGLAQALAGFAVLAAAGLDLGLGLALVGQQGLQLDLVLGQRFVQGLEVGVEAAELERLELRVLVQALGLQGLVLLGGAGLALEVFELLVHFLAQVVEAVEVLAGGLDARFGFLAALLVLGDAGGFLQVHAQVFGAGLDDLADHALLDDRVAARAKTGAQEKVGDVAAAAAGAVEVIVRLAVAADHALDGDFRIAGVFAADAALGVVEHQLHLGLADRLAGGRAGEDDVGERIAAQAAGRTFAHHPAHGVDDVGLAAAVGTDHAGHVGRQVQHRRVNEGFESGQLDGGKAHSWFFSSSRPVVAGHGTPGRPAAGSMGSSRTGPGYTPSD